MSTSRTLRAAARHLEKGETLAPRDAVDGMRISVIVEALETAHPRMCRATHTTIRDAIAELRIIIEAAPAKFPGRTPIVSGLRALERIDARVERPLPLMAEREPTHQIEDEIDAS